MRNVSCYSKQMGLILLAFLSVDASAVTVIGSAGSLGANGVVTSPPSGASSYGWVSTWGGVPLTGLSYIDIDQPSQGGIQYFNGSLLRSDVFSATAGSMLQFDFNYVTSDGADIADYAWARLLDTSNNEMALLFTARNNPSGSFIPGASMPPAAATLTPGAMLIIGGAPSWLPLGGSSGTCFRVGCGYTGWGQANYSLLASGSYVLEFGVTNWNDTNYDSGLAFSNVTIAGNPINTSTAVEIDPGGGPGPGPTPTDPGSTTGSGTGTGTAGTGSGSGAAGANPVPVPAALWLFGSGLVGLAGIRRANKKGAF
jgi:hypothetical protein